jgi:hypothetical protein
MGGEWGVGRSTGGPIVLVGYGSSDCNNGQKIRRIAGRRRAAGIKARFAVTVFVTAKAANYKAAIYKATTRLILTYSDERPTLR